MESEIRDWLESFEYFFKHGKEKEAKEILQSLQDRAQLAGIEKPFCVNTPYLNTISVGRQPQFPGNLAIEERIESIVRWNAMDMVVRANTDFSGIGGHLSTYASAATLFEVGFNHFFRAPQESFSGDFVYFQGHASPGVYARAFLEGRLSEEQLLHFRREVQKGGGLSSYPHPLLMPDFWQFSTVSMGLSAILAIYHARFNRYLEDRGLKPKDDAKVWAFIGDGECDEPESLGALTVASRECLDNLIVVVNCNLQRLDGPVRGNGKIIQELEAIFRGAGWNVIKVIWGSDWDPLLAKDTEGALAVRMQLTVDGQYQKYSAEEGEYFRKDFFGKDPRLLEMVKHLSDEQLHNLKRGGHDVVKVYAAYQAAVNFKGAPSVILAKTIKGYGLGEAGEGKNITHQEKKLSFEEMKQFRTRFSIPLSDEQIAKESFYKPAPDSPEMKYLQERRKKLGGFLPQRRDKANSLNAPDEKIFSDFYQDSGERIVSTTMVYVRMLAALLRDKSIGKYIVPIIPDEARTFGMDSLFREFGIYSHVGQRYEPVDIKNIIYYREAKDGQILEEGITEAGAISSFIAAATCYSSQATTMIPFYTYYSMFGPQRVGDLVWAAADMCARGFLVGGTSGRTALNGEGLQHQDGHSHVLFSTVPSCKAYLPAFAYEIAVIILDGIERMCQKQENVFYYLNVANEPYHMPAMPQGSREGILRGMYKLKASMKNNAKNRIQLLGSGTIINQVLQAQELLEEKFDTAADIWSVTSFTELRKDALEAARWNMLHPFEEQKVPYVSACLKGQGDVFVAASDFLKALPDGIAKWVPGELISLGTDGFGRSDTREVLRDFFEIDARHIAYAGLGSLYRKGLISAATLNSAAGQLCINAEKINPMIG